MKTAMQAWASRQMRTCKCGRKYIAPSRGARGGWYKSERKHPEMCWRCEKAKQEQKP